jgi:hypothetical protein
MPQGQPPVIAWDEFILVKDKVSGKKQSVPAWHIRDGGVPPGFDVVPDTLHTRSMGVEPDYTLQ